MYTLTSGRLSRYHGALKRKSVGVTACGIQQAARNRADHRISIFVLDPLDEIPVDGILADHPGHSHHLAGGRIDQSGSRMNIDVTQTCFSVRAEGPGDVVGSGKSQRSHRAGPIPLGPAKFHGPVLRIVLPLQVACHGAFHRMSDIGCHEPVPVIPSVEILDVLDIVLPERPLDRFAGPLFRRKPFHVCDGEGQERLSQGDMPLKTVPAIIGVVGERRNGQRD